MVFIAQIDGGNLGDFEVQRSDECQVQCEMEERAPDGRAGRHDKGLTWQAPCAVCGRVHMSSQLSRGPASVPSACSWRKESGPIAAIRHADALGSQWGWCLVLSTSDDSCDDPSPLRSRPQCPWWIIQIQPPMMMVIRALLNPPSPCNPPSKLLRSAGTAMM